MNVTRGKRRGDRGRVYHGGREGETGGECNTGQEKGRPGENVTRGKRRGDRGRM